MKKIIVPLLPLFFIYTTSSSQITQTTASKKLKDAVMGSSRNFQYSSGKINVKFAAYQPAKDDVKTTSSPLNSAMCLTKEEVRGQKIENEQIIADGSKAEGVLPGAVIDAEVLLNSGQFSYIKMDKRKPVTLTTPSNLVKKSISTVTPVGSTNILGKLMDARQSLTVSTNMKDPNVTPNVGSSSTVIVSTLQEKMSLEIGASAFYMGISVEDNFKFSSEHYRYMYLYQFEQKCITVMANNITSAADVFTDNSVASNNWLYIPEVSYGRRLYVIIESEYDLKKYSNELKGSLNWAAVSAAYQQKNTGESLSSKTNIRIVTEGGQAVPLTDTRKIQQALENYFEVKYQSMEIVPLTYKLTYLDGKPVSVISEAFLNSDKCLDKNRVRIALKEIKCEVASDNSEGTEQLYGAVAIALYNSAGKQVGVDGKTLMPEVAQNLQIPTTTIVYAKDATPLVLKGGGEPKTYAENAQGSYVDVSISNLDMMIEAKPTMKEKDDFDDDVFGTNDRLKKTLRQMLIEGSTTTTFEFRHENSKVTLTITITPL
jgi:Thiol-activated cytolysin